MAGPAHATLGRTSKEAPSVMARVESERYALQSPIRRAVAGRPWLEFVTPMCDARCRMLAMKNCRLRLQSAPQA